MRVLLTPIALGWYTLNAMTQRGNKQTTHIQVEKHPNCFPGAIALYLQGRQCQQAVYQGLQSRP
ncbi:MAG: hypothetical protein ACFE0J_09895 [Elainellaceae cyanobacterium]